MSFTGTSPSAFRSYSMDASNTGNAAFVELDPLPEGLAAQPLVLQPVSVGLLGGDEIGEHIARVIDGAQGNQGSPTFHQVAAPNQMISTRLSLASPHGTAMLATSAPG